MARRETLFSAFVGGIPLDFEEGEIRHLFSRCGLIEHMYITFSEKNRCKYGFIRYNTVEECIQTVTDLHRWNINGSRLIVDFASDTVDRVKAYQDGQKQLTNTKRSSQIGNDQRKTINTKAADRVEHKPKGQEVACKTSINHNRREIDAFSVFVGDLHNDVTERDLLEMFSSCGLVDGIFRKRDNFGFVHYSCPEDAVKAVQLLNGGTIRNQAIVVELTRATASRLPKELLPPELEVVTSKCSTMKESRLNYYSVHTSHIPSDASKRDVELLFSSCGSIQDMFMTAYEDSGRQYGFVRYSHIEEAMDAVTKLDGRKLKNIPIRVQYANDTKDRMPKETKPANAAAPGSGVKVERKISLPVDNHPASASSTCTPRPRSQRHGLDLCSVYIGHIHPDVTKKAITNLFSGCGHVYDVFIQDSEGDYKYGFVRFGNMKEVSNAVTHLNGWKMKDCPIVVDISHETLKRTRSGRNLRCLIPSVDPNFQFDEKMGNNSAEMESVINRSRLYETYSVVRSKMSALKGPSIKFNNVLDNVDKTLFSNKHFAWRTSLSHGGRLSVHTVDRALKTRSSELTAEMFMDKFAEMTRAVGNLMKGINLSPNRKSISQNSSPLASHKTNTDLSSVNRRDIKQLEPSCLKNSIVSTPQAQPKTASPSCTSGSRAVSRGSRRMEFSPPTQLAVMEDNLSLIELGRRWKKERSNGRSSQQGGPQLRLDNVSDSDDSFENENIGHRLASSKIKMYEPEKEEGWGKLTQAHSAWASDLFCQFVDSECDESPTGSSTGRVVSPSMSSSSENCLSAPESSGYSSFYESGDFGSKKNGDRSRSAREKNVKSGVKQSQIESGVDDIIRKSSLFRIP